MNKKVQYLFTLICSICLFTACEGNKDNSWELMTRTYDKENLVLSYGETVLTGKEVTFSATNSNDGSLLLKNVIPGEEEATITNITVNNSEFTGVGNTTNAKVEYTGSVKEDVMTLKLNVTMNDPNGWAKSYQLADYTVKNTGKKDSVLTGALYINWIAPGTNAGPVASMYRGIGGVLLPQVLKKVTLETDGNITASYHKGPITFDMGMAFGLMGGTAPTQEAATALIPTDGWLDSPKNLAHWFVKDNKLYVKLNIIGIMSQSMGEEANALSGMISLILQSSPADIKTTLKNLTGIDFSSISDETFEMLLSWLNNGIPMNVSSVDGRTQLYLDKAALNPLMVEKTTGTTVGMNSDLIKLWQLLVSAKIIPQEANLAYLLLLNLPQNWDKTTEFGLGLDLVH